MKIISLVAENFKRLQAVEIRPDGHLVQITGKNGNGKSSVLDAVWAALAGKDVCPQVPIRRGQERAVIKLDLGEIIVKRTFLRAEGDEYTTQITVENAEGAHYSGPQRMLDALLGELTFDPLEFARMKPGEQFEQLRRFVPDVDFAAIDGLNRGDYTKRTEVNRFLEQERAAAKAIVVPEGTPEELVDENKLVGELADAGRWNADIAQRRANRKHALEVVERSRQAVGRVDVEIAEATRMAQVIRDREIGRLQEQIRGLQAQIDEVNAGCDKTIEEESKTLRRKAQEADALADDIERQLKDAGELPPEVDVPGLQRRIETARVTNANVRQLFDRKKHERAAEQLAANAKALTDSIDQRNADKQAKIAAAQMPIDGIAFGDGVVLFKGIPLAQASSAEQLSTSVAIAMALKPKLRVMLIREGSLLDEDSLQLIAEMADQRDFQCWIERVDSSGKVGFILEDGQVRKAASTEAAA